MADREPPQDQRVRFASDYGRALFPGGREVRFTRSERLVLEKIASERGRIVSRNQILDVLEGGGLERGDRNIDYLVNRIRRKLGDSARSPSFIRTQYGEGYGWVAGSGRTAGSAPGLATGEGSFLVIGPLQGVGADPAALETGRRFCAALEGCLSQRLAKGRRVVLVEDYDPGSRADDPRYHLEVTLTPAPAHPTELDALVALYRDGSRLLHISRHGTRERTPAAEDPARQAADLVDLALWRTEAFVDGNMAASDHSPPVRLFSSGRPFTDNQVFVENDRRLRRQIATDPADAQSRLMLAVNIHSKYVMCAGIYPASDHRAEDEREMERLVLSALPGIRDHSALALTAAKLLHFLGGEHRPRALELAESAFSEATALASASATYGQLRLFEGAVSEAVDLFERSIALQAPEPEPMVRGYVEVLLCKACQAAANWEGLRRARGRLAAVQPEADRFLCWLFRAPDGRLDGPELERVLERFDLSMARALLRKHTYISARLFAKRTHRLNILSGPTGLLCERFGEEVLPTETRALLQGPSEPLSRAASA